jgi:hypothetical protein
VACRQLDGSSIWVLKLTRKTRAWRFALFTSTWLSPLISFISVSLPCLACSLFINQPSIRFDLVISRLLFPLDLCNNKLKSARKAWLKLTKWEEDKFDRSRGEGPLTPQSSLSGEQDLAQTCSAGETGDWLRGRGLCHRKKARQVLLRSTMPPADELIQEGKTKLDVGLNSAHIDLDQPLIKLSLWRRRCNIHQ